MRQTIKEFIYVMFLSFCLGVYEIADMIKDVIKPFFLVIFKWIIIPFVLLYCCKKQIMYELGRLW